MTVHTAVTVQHGTEITVPLSKLKRSPKNARRTPHRAEDVETLAASIAVKGVLQPPVVSPERNDEGQETGAYLVTIGEGRRLALALLAKRKTISKSEPIQCLLDQDNDPFEVSLDENVTRFAMHPADQYEAFRDLAENKGWGAEEIGARFGLSPQVVRQRLRLGAASPTLMAAYRAGGLSLEQLMAFVVSEDHARQEQVFADLSYNRSPSFIRRLMTEHEVEATDRRARFVGVEAYEAAGGHIRRDLFVEDRGGWFEDVALLNRLTLEKLTATAETIRAEEGWRWTEAHLDYPRDHGFRRLYPEPTAPDGATQARLAELEAEYQAIADHGEDPTEEEQARLREIDAAFEAASRPVYAPEAYERAGVFVVLDYDGQVRIERGFIRPEDERPEPEPDTPSGEEPAGTMSDQVEEAVEAGPKPLADSLIADLTAHRTSALRDTLAMQPDAAFLAALHAMVLQTFYAGRDENCLEFRVTSTRLRTFAEAYDQSVAGRSIEARHEDWAKRLPESTEAAWETLVGLSTDDRMALFAHCVSLTVNAVQIFGRSSRALRHADMLATHLNLDMTQYWRATPESYFGRISKAQILDAVREAVSPEAATRIEGLKKDAMAQAATDLLGSGDWLPPLLKTAAATPA